MVSAEKGIISANKKNDNRLSAMFALTVLMLSGLLMNSCTEGNNATSEVENAVEITPDKVDMVQTIQHGDQGVDGSKLGMYSVESPEITKINLNLLQAEKLAKVRGVAFADAAADMGILTDNGGVVLDIVTNHSDTSIEKKFRIHGIKILYVSAKYNRISVVISKPALLYQLAKIFEVRTIMPAYGGRTRGSIPERTMRSKPKRHL